MTGDHDTTAAGLRELAEAMATMPVEVAACSSCGTRAYGYVPVPCIGKPEVIKAALSGLDRNPLGRGLALYLLATVEPHPVYGVNGSEPGQAWDVAAGRIAVEGSLQECVDMLDGGLLCLCNAGRE